MFTPRTGVDDNDAVAGGGGGGGTPASVTTPLAVRTPTPLEFVRGMPATVGFSRHYGGAGGAAAVLPYSYERMRQELDAKEHLVSTLQTALQQTEKILDKLSFGQGDWQRRAAQQQAYIAHLEAQLSQSAGAAEELDRLNEVVRRQQQQYKELLTISQSNQRQLEQSVGLVERMDGEIRRLQNRLHSASMPGVGEDGGEDDGEDDGEVVLRPDVQLRRVLQQRDAEIATLRQQVATLQHKQPAQQQTPTQQKLPPQQQQVQTQQQQQRDEVDERLAELQRALDEKTEENQTLFRRLQEGRDAARNSSNSNSSNQQREEALKRDRLLVQLMAKQPVLEAQIEVLQQKLELALRGSAAADYAAGSTSPINDAQSPPRSPPRSGTRGGPAPSTDIIRRLSAKVPAGDGSEGGGKAEVEGVAQQARDLVAVVWKVLQLARTYTRNEDATAGPAPDDEDDAATAGEALARVRELVLLIKDELAVLATAAAAQPV